MEKVKPAGSNGKSLPAGDNSHFESSSSQRDLRPAYRTSIHGSGAAAR